jgi:hypothetical protein
MSRSRSLNECPQGHGLTGRVFNRALQIKFPRERWEEKEKGRKACRPAPPSQPI